MNLRRLFLTASAIQLVLFMSISARAQSSRYDALADAPTAGKRPLPAMRCYGPTEALNNKSFKLPDLELIA